MKCMNLLAWCFDQWQAKHVDQSPECFASDAKVVGEPTWRGNGILEAKQWMVTLVAILAMGTVTNANAGLFGLGGTSWREEVLLHDGGKVIVERSQNYGGRHEIGQSPPVKEHTITFTLPDSGKAIKWKSEYGEDIGRTNFNLLALHVLNGVPYLIVEPNLCLSYNKWGRPNPPYVIFKFDGNAWVQIQVAALPSEFKAINLIVNNGREEDIQKAANQLGYVSAESVHAINSSLRQPEYQTILREALPQDRITQLCEERVLYKGYWILPNDPVARKFIDQQKR